MTTATKSREWYSTVFLLLITVSVVYASILMIYPFLPQYLQTMGVQGEELMMWVGVISGAPFFTMFLISPIWGRMADRWGYKWMLIRATVGTALVTFLMAWATTPWEFLLLRLLEGLLSGVIPVAMAMVSAVVPKERSQYALSIVQSGLMVGVATGPLLGGWLVQWFQSLEDPFASYRHTFLIATAALVAVVFMVVFFLREKKVTAEEARSRGASQGKIWAQSKRFLCQRPLGILLLIAFAIYFAIFNYVSFMSVLIEQLAASREEALRWTSWSWAALAIASGIASPLLGKLGDRWGAAKILAFCLLSTAVTVAASASVGYVQMMPVLSFLVGFFSAGLMPSLNVLMVREVSSEEIGSVYGLQSSLSALGEGTGPICLGFLAYALGDLVGSEPRLVFMVSGLMTLGIFSIFWFSKSIKRNSKAR